MRRTSVRAFLAIPVMALAVTLSLSPAAGLQRALAAEVPDNVIELPDGGKPKDDEPAAPEGWQEDSGKRTYWRDGQRLTGIQTDLLPAMNLPYLMVITTYPGASPEQVEADVTKPLENALSTLNGVKNVTSKSIANDGPLVLV